MCAIFGFIARRESDDPKASVRHFDVHTLHGIIRANLPRGPHASGFAWIDGRGRLRMFKQAGRLTDHLPILRMAADARLLIGNLRYATHGDPRDNLNNHPHPVDGGWLVHNGVIRNHAELVRRHELSPVSKCDTEVLGLLTECVDEINGARRRGRLWRMGRAAALCEGALAALSLWSRKCSWPSAAGIRCTGALSPRGCILLPAIAACPGGCGRCRTTGPAASGPARMA